MTNYSKMTDVQRVEYAYASIAERDTIKPIVRRRKNARDYSFGVDKNVVRVTSSNKMGTQFIR